MKWRQKVEVRRGSAVAGEQGTRNRRLPHPIWSHEDDKAA